MAEEPTRVISYDDDDDDLATEKGGVQEFCQVLGSAQFWPCFKKV